MSIFTRNLMPKVKTSMFGLTHTNTLTLDMPYLVPILCRDVLPGDTWQVQSEVFLRMMPMLSPIMQDVDVYVHYFHVPLRLLVHDYDSFFNPEEQEGVYRPFIDPLTVVDFIESYEVSLLPIDPSKRTASMKSVYELASSFAESSLADYLGIPVFSWSDIEVKTDETLGQCYDVHDLCNRIGRIPKFSAFPFLMYQLIYDSYYRDQTLEDAILDGLEDLVSGWNFDKIDTSQPFSIDDDIAILKLMGLRTRAWKKDYFTSALPTPQAGPDVHLPLSGNADVILKPDMTVAEAADAQRYIPVSDVTPNTNLLHRGVSNGQGDQVNLGVSQTNTGGYVKTYFDPNGTMEADLSGVTSATINELRRAVRAQEFLEKCARGGRRYIEMILSHFGVRSSDGRLDRPEFLGGGRQPFTISEVLSHVGEGENDNFILGEMGGHGVSYGAASKTRRFFEEHGYIFAILSILPKASYQQGLERHWTRETIFDYAWPTFANLGEQEILNKEIYAQGDNPDGVFGYAPRYSEYKYIPSTVHGAMRSTLSYWHLGRIFSSAPALNASFVHPKPVELKRIFAVQAEENSILGVVRNHVQVRRTLPKYGIPTL